MNTIAYQLLTIFLWPVFFIYTLKISLRDKSKRYLFQRLGFNYPKQKTKPIWIHCASVGEVNTYMPLHLKLLASHPDTQFVITTNTTTGADTVKRHAADRTTHYYLPIESIFPIKRFLKSCNPSQCLIMETEIWPLLYKQCHADNISISIINARLSHRTLSANSWIKTIYRSSLDMVDKILCKSETELNNYKKLGAIDEKLITAGNLKFSTNNNTSNITAIELSNREYCLAASTHNNEEEQLANLWRKLNTDKLLVIAPRHPNRSTSIQQQLNSLGIKYSVRSKQQNIESNTQVYLADTLGELTQFMAGANLVLIGGSLIKHGGQNILEAAALSKAIICGPHMFNFKDETELLLKNNGCIQVGNLNELETTIIDILNNTELTHTLGCNAKNALEQCSDVIDNYVSLLDIHL